jgi:hypothetical protein
MDWARLAARPEKLWINQPIPEPGCFRSFLLQVRCGLPKFRVEAQFMSQALIVSDSRSRERNAGCLQTLVLSALLVFSSAPAALAAESVDYPKTAKLPGGTVVVHHPTVSDWKDFSVLSAWLPVEITPSGSSTPWIGSVEVQALTEIRFEERIVQLSGLRPVKAVADESLPEAAQSLKDSPGAYPLLQEALKQARQTISLEYLLRALPEELADSLISSTRHAIGAREKKAPEIILSEQPAVLMLFDGPPATQPIRDSRLEIVVNSPWLVFHDKAGDQWYAVFGDYWLQNSSLSGGSWQVASTLPEDISNLAMANGWEGLARLLPPKQTDRRPPPFKLSYEPAELVLFDGPPRIQDLNGTELQLVANSDHDLFQYQGRYYLLLAGRWWSSKDLKGRWDFVEELPAEFARIPADSDRAHVLATVPGTEDYRIATLEAAVARSQSGAQDDGAGTPSSAERNPGRQAYVHTYGYSGTYTADKGLKKDGPQGSGSYYDPTYDPGQRDPYFMMSFGYGGYWPPYGYGARYYPAYGAYRYGGYYDPFWGNPYPYPMSTSTTYDVADDDKDWVIDEDGQKRAVSSGPARNYIGSGTYHVDGRPTGIDDPTAAGHWYSGPDGKLYRVSGAGWQIQQGKKWIPLEGPVPDSVAREYQARLAGYASYQRYQQDQATEQATDQARQP